MDTRTIEKVSKALGDPYRIKIMEAVQQENTWLPCSAIRERLNLAQPTVSHHLKQLVDSDLLIAEKEGRTTKYMINNEAVGAYIHFLRSFKRK